MNNTEFIKWLKSENACKGGIKSVGEFSAKEFWDNCQRGDWLLWWAQKVNIDIRLLTLAKARCAETVIHLMKDDRSKEAVRVAISYGQGFATKDKLKDASDAASDAAAYASDAASDAAAYAANAANAAAYAANAAFYASDYISDVWLDHLKKCADIVRAVISYEIVENKLK